MGKGFDIEIKFNLLPDMPAEVRADIGEVVKEITFAVEGNAKRRSRVDTGQMQAGWNSTFPAPMTGVVSNPVEHVIYNEFGTDKMSAQPMLRPAVEDERQRYESKCAAVLKKAGR